jgi:hypothetical protein
LPRNRGAAFGLPSDCNGVNCGVIDQVTFLPANGAPHRIRSERGRASGSEGVCSTALELREAGSLLRDRSSALPMTAEAQARTRGEKRCRPEQRHLLALRLNQPTRFPSVRWLDDVATSNDPSPAIRPMLNAVPSSCLGKATLTSAFDLRL